MKEKLDPNQIKIDLFGGKKKEVEKIVEKDSKGRTRDDIIKESGVKKEDKNFLNFINSIVFKDREYYIYGTQADSWISYNNKIFGPKIKKQEKEVISEKEKIFLEKEYRRKKYSSGNWD